MEIGRNDGNRPRRFFEVSRTHPCEPRDGNPRNWVSGVQVPSPFNFRVESRNRPTRPFARRSDSDKVGYLKYGASLRYGLRQNFLGQGPSSNN